MDKKTFLANLRVHYDLDELNFHEIENIPIAQFNKWLNDAIEVGADKIIEPNAMVLATADENGVISSRSVLLKGIDEHGLSFYTNYNSQKAKEMDKNPNVSVTFPWYPLHRQVNVIGKVSKLSRKESEEYFYSRPHKSQLGAIVSAQSEIIESRDVLEKAMANLENEYPEGTKIPMPQNWGGYLIKVSSMEFWQGRQSRLHDRLRFVRKGESCDLSNPNAWKIVRVSP